MIFPLPVASSRIFQTDWNPNKESRMSWQHWENWPRLQKEISSNCQTFPPLFPSLWSASPSSRLRVTMFPITPLTPKTRKRKPLRLLMLKSLDQLSTLFLEKVIFLSLLEIEVIMSGNAVKCPWISCQPCSWRRQCLSVLEIGVFMSGSVVKCQTHVL